MKAATRRAAAVVTDMAINPLTEGSRAAWTRWSEDRADRDAAERIQATAEKATDRAVYAREIAEAIADDAAKVVPDWRLLRPEVAAAFIKIVRQQPEYRQREVGQRESMLRLIEDNLPTHIRPLMQDLRTIHELTALARESAAFLVGHATGRKARHTDDHGRRAGLRPNRKPLRLALAADTTKGAC